MLAGVALAVAAAGCTSGGATPTEPTVPTAAPTTASTTTATTAPVDIGTIPEVIDEDYLNRVLAALDEVDGMATRVIKANTRFGQEAAAILNAIYRGDEFSEQADLWLDTLYRDASLDGIRSNPGRRTTVVERIIEAAPDCVWVAVRRDYSQTATAPPPATTEYVALGPKAAADDPQRRNPTGWMIDVDGFNEDGSEPENQCADS